MAKEMPALQNLIALSFVDYVRLRDLIKHDGDLPTEVVSQHDSDKVTYAEAYNESRRLMNELQHYADSWYDYNSELSSAIVTLLYNKKLITKEEMLNIPKIAIKLLKEEQKNNEAKQD